jgi:hypothetical protein
MKLKESLTEELLEQDGIPSKIELKVYRLFCKIMIKVLSLIESFLKKSKDPAAKELLIKIKAYKLKYKLENIAAGAGVGLHNFAKDAKRTFNDIDKAINEADNDLNFNFEFKLSPYEVLKMVIDGVKLTLDFGKMVKALPPGEEKAEGQQLYKEAISEFRSALPQIKIPGIHRAVAMLPAPDTLKEEIIALSKRNII